MNKVLKPLIEAGVIESTIPNAPNHPQQKYKTVTKHMSEFPVNYLVY